jgi:hypothetical protein
MHGGVRVAGGEGGLSPDHDTYRKAAFRRLVCEGEVVDERMRGGSIRRAGEGAASRIPPMTAVPLYETSRPAVSPGMPTDRTDPVRRTRRVP